MVCCSHNRYFFALMSILWQSDKVPSDWRKGSFMSFFNKGKKDHGNHQSVSITIVPSKITEQVLLNAMTSCMDDKKVLRDRQHTSPRANYA